MKLKYAKQQEWLLQLITGLTEQLPYLNISKEHHLALSSYLTISLHKGEAMKFSEYNEYSNEMATQLVDFMNDVYYTLNISHLSNEIPNEKSDGIINLVHLDNYVKGARARHLTNIKRGKYLFANYKAEQDDHIMEHHFTSKSFEFRIDEYQHDRVTVTVKDNGITGKKAVTFSMEAHGMKNIGDFFTDMHNYFKNNREFEKD